MAYDPEALPHHSHGPHTPLPRHVPTQSHHWTQEHRGDLTMRDLDYGQAQMEEYYNQQQQYGGYQHEWEEGNGNQGAEQNPKASRPPPTPSPFPTYKKVYQAQSPRRSPEQYDYDLEFDRRPLQEAAYGTQDVEGRRPLTASCPPGEVRERRFAAIANSSQASQRQLEHWANEPMSNRPSFELANWAIATGDGAEYARSPMDIYGDNYDDGDLQGDPEDGLYQASPHNRSQKEAQMPKGFGPQLEHWAIEPIPNRRSGSFELANWAIATGDGTEQARSPMDLYGHNYDDGDLQGHPEDGWHQVSPHKKGHREAQKAKRFGPQEKKGHQKKKRGTRRKKGGPQGAPTTHTRTSTPPGGPNTHQTPPKGHPRHPEAGRPGTTRAERGGEEGQRRQERATNQAEKERAERWYDPARTQAEEYNARADKAERELKANLKAHIEATVEASINHRVQTLTAAIEANIEASINARVQALTDRLENIVGGRMEAMGGRIEAMVGNRVDSARAEWTESLQRMHGQTVADMATLVEDHKRLEAEVQRRDAERGAEVQRVQQTIMASMVGGEAVEGVQQRQVAFEELLKQYLEESNKATHAALMARLAETEAATRANLKVFVEEAAKSMREEWTAQIDKVAQENHERWKATENLHQKHAQAMTEMTTLVEDRKRMEAEVQRCLGTFEGLVKNYLQESEKMTRATLVARLVEAEAATRTELKNYIERMARMMRVEWMTHIDRVAQANQERWRMMEASSSRMAAPPVKRTSPTQRSTSPTPVAAPTPIVEPQPTVQAPVMLRPGLLLKKSKASGGVAASNPVPIVVGVHATQAQPTAAAPSTAVQIRQVGVAPVTTAASPQPPIPTTAFLPLGVAQALVGKEPGRFSGTSDAWPTWRRKWLSYLKEVEEVHTGITNRQRLTMLRHWLDPSGAELLDHELQTAPDTEYESYWARIDLSYGAEDKESLRRQLKSQRLQTRGKVTERDWRDYATKVILLARQLGDIGDLEVGRLLSEGLPSHPWRRKLAEEAEKRSHHGTLVIDGLPSDVSEAEVVEMIRVETTRQPLRVSRSGARVKVTAVDDAHKEAIKIAFDRQQLACGANLAVAPEAGELTGDEVNALMLRWLRIDARVNSGGDRRDTNTESAMRQAYDPSRRRFQREVQVQDDGEDELTETEAEVAEVKGRERTKKPITSSQGGPPSAPATPPPPKAAVTPETPTPAAAPISAPSSPAAVNDSGGRQWMGYQQPGRGKGYNSNNREWMDRRGSREWADQGGGSREWNDRGGRGWSKGSAEREWGQSTWRDNQKGKSAKGGKGDGGKGGRGQRAE